MVNNSVLPTFFYLTHERFHHIPITNADILTLIRGLNPIEANGPDGISPRLLII